MKSRISRTARIAMTFDGLVESIVLATLSIFEDDAGTSVEGANLEAALVGLSETRFCDVGVGVGLEVDKGNPVEEVATIEGTYECDDNVKAVGAVVSRVDGVDAKTVSREVGESLI